MTEIPTLGDLQTRNRSVDNTSAYGDGTMNVWQTLEVISGNNLRKQYHYDGYSDSENVLRTLTNSTHRRESFAEKAKSQERTKKYSDSAGGDSGIKAEQVDANHLNNPQDSRDKKTRSSVTVIKGKRKGKPIVVDPTEKDATLLLTLECTDLVQCSFNIPRISARLERLMGTNVVRLTDRNYMKELRQRLDDDYRMQLANRIKNREIKELERERNLILEGKTDTIPEELSADPIFVVNKRANVEIDKRRAKLKTNREKNADRLQRQGLKWKRERSRHEEQERLKQKELARIAQEQAALEEQYKEEDAQRGLDLLRLNDVEWQDCEQNLRDFLEAERSKMKERSLLVPQPYSSDPQDIQNIIRARKKFRETEQRIRKQLLEKSQKPQGATRTFAGKVSKLMSAVGAFATHARKKLDDGEVESHVSRDQIYLGDDEASGIPSSSASLQQLPGRPDDIKLQKVTEMKSQVEADVHKGFLVTKNQYSSLRYDDMQIAKLREAGNIRELYQIAEKIIIGDLDEEVMGLEEFEFEDDEPSEM